MHCLHQLDKRDVIPKKMVTWCHNAPAMRMSCAREDVALIEDFQTNASEKLLEYSDSGKHKFAYIAGFLVHKCQLAAETKKIQY